MVEFLPGTARLNDAGQQVLATVASALEDRPALKMTATGAADPASGRQAPQRAQLDGRLLAERQRERLRAGPGGAAAVVAAKAAGPAPSASAPTAAADTPPLSANQRTRLRKAVYQQPALPNKPRNALGPLRSDLPVPEMEALLPTCPPATAACVRWRRRAAWRCAMR